MRGTMFKKKNSGGPRPHTGPAREWLRLKLGETRMDDLRLYAWRKNTTAENVMMDLFARWYWRDDVQEQIGIARTLREIERTKLPPRPASNPRRKR